MSSGAADGASDRIIPPQRLVADRCPGALRLIDAADGYLGRVRLPGGFVTAEQLRALARLASDLGDGRVELTSRGNVQLRALAEQDAARLTDELTAAGLLPSLDHDRVRNILASPLAGLDSGDAPDGPTRPGSGDAGPGLADRIDLAAVVRALDAGLCARPRLAELSGRFLFAVDDGRGDVAGLGADVVAVVTGAAASVNGLAVDEFAGRGTGPVGSWADAIATVMLAFAEVFLDERDARAAALPGGPVPGGAAWRIADLPGGADRVQAIVARRFGLTPVPMPGAARKQDKTAGLDTPIVAAGRPVGVIARPRAGNGGENDRSVPDEDRGAAVVLLAPLGRLSADQVRWLAGQVRGRPARVTPWRSVVLPDQGGAAEVLREAAGLGFGVDERSPWLRVTACAGRPGCARALADVQADAAGFAARWPDRIVHVSGCARHCGRPAATEVDVTATSEGYEVAGA